MSDRFSEERELLEALRQREKAWQRVRWILPFIGLYFMFYPKSLGDPNTLRVGLAMIFLVYVFSKWNGDPASRLLIKLYEEKLENEFIEDEVAKFKQNPSKPS